MRYLIALAMLVCAGLAYAALTKPSEGEPVIQGRYQIVAATDGSVWRVDATMGFVHRCVMVQGGPACAQAK